LLRVLDVPGLNLSPEPGYPDCEAFHDFTQSLQAIAGIVPKVMSQSVPLKSFPVHYSLTI
jgi:hypothetical protein